MNTILRLAAFLLFASHAHAVSAQPNIVVVMTDDQDDTGSMDTMPKTYDLLTSKGIRFTNSFAQFPVCGPARTSLLTGQVGHNHGVNDNGPHTEFDAREDESLGVWLQRAGYRTGIMGKILNSWTPHIMPGWDEFRGLTPPADTYFGFSVLENGQTRSYSQSDYSTDYLADAAEAFVRSSTGPFFLLVTPNAPHIDANGAVPAAPRDEGAFSGLQITRRPNFNEADMSDKPPWLRNLPLVDGLKMDQDDRDRREALLSVDDMIARLVAALGSRLDNTVFILSSDNGFSFGSHRWTNKFYLYEEAIRVPLIIRGPGIPAGQTRSQLVTNLDLVATILDYAGATATNPVDGGRSLRPLFLDGSAPWRTAFLIEGERKTWDYRHFVGVRTAKSMFSQDTSQDGSVIEEFYALEPDPYEEFNRANADRFQIRIGQLRQLTQDLSDCVGDECWVDDPAWSIAKLR